METYNPVGWFEIPVTDMDRAERFYQTLLNIELTRQPEHNGMLMSWFPMHEEAKGATGCLMQHQAYVPSKDAGVLIYFTTPDLEAALARATEAGGSVQSGKKAIGEYGFIGLIIDSEGNRIALHSRTG